MNSTTWTCKRGPGCRGGFALAVVLMISLILAITGMGLLRVGSAARQNAVEGRAEMIARNAADAGLVYAIYEMNAKLSDERGDWNNKQLPFASDFSVPDAMGQFSYTVTGDPLTGFEIEATGTYGQTTHTVHSTLRLAGLFETAISVQDRMDLYAKTTVEGYNSETGQKGLPVKLGTNSIEDDMVVIKNGSVVNGSVFVGLGGDPGSVVDNHGTITGSTYSLLESLRFPEIVPPEFGGNPKPLDIDHDRTLRPGQSGVYSSMSVSRKGHSDTTLEVDGGEVVLHITGDIDIGKDAAIQVNPGAALVIYLDGNFYTREGADLNNVGQKPANFAIYGIGDNQFIDLKAKSEFFGVVYAPTADVEVKAKGDVYGSILAEDFEMKAKGDFHYDVTLQEVELDDVGSRFVVDNWWED